MPDPKGLGLHELKFCPPDPAWLISYKQECKRLSALPSVLAVEHIGSTAIPGIKAKPVVDIAVAVEGDPASSGIRALFEQLGYMSHGEYGLPGRQFFTLGTPPAVHVHVVATGSPYWRDWIDFRNYLIAHPEEARRYEHEKLRLSKKVKGDRPSYTKGKTSFVAEILAKSRGGV